MKVKQATILKELVDADEEVFLLVQSGGGYTRRKGYVVDGGKGWLALSDWPANKIRFETIFSVRPNV